MEMLSEWQVLTYKITPAHTTGLDFSKSIFQPYNPVPKATRTDDQPNASRTSVWMKFCRNSSGWERNWRQEITSVVAPKRAQVIGGEKRTRLRASSQAFLRSEAFMLFIFVTSSSRCLSFSLSAKTERGPMGRVESSEESADGAEPLEADFLAMTLTRRV